MYIPVVIPNLTCGVWKRVKIPKQVFFGPVRVFWEVQTPKGGNHTFFNSHLLVANHADNADPSRALMMTLRCPFQCYGQPRLSIRRQGGWRCSLVAAAAAAAAGAAPDCLSAQIRQVASDDVDMSTCQESKTHARCQQPNDVMVPNVWSHAPVNYLDHPRLQAPTKVVFEQNLQYMGHLTVVNGFFLGYTQMCPTGVFCSVNAGWTTIGVQRPCTVF